MKTGVDLDIDIRKEKNHWSKAHCVYSDSKYNIIEECTVYAETVYPLTLIQAIKVFKPINSKYCNVNFESVTGIMSETSVIKF